MYFRSIKGLRGRIRQTMVRHHHKMKSLLVDGHNLDTTVGDCITQDNTADTTWDTINASETRRRSHDIRNGSPKLQVTKVKYHQSAIGEID